MAVTGVHAWLVLWRAWRAVDSAARANVESLGLGMTDFAVLEVLLHKGPLPVNVVGAKVLLTSGSVTTAVDRLESRGLVQRAFDPNDRRTRIVKLTPAGRKMIKCAFRDHERRMEEVFGVLSETERERLVDLLKRVGLEAERVTV